MSQSESDNESSQSDEMAQDEDQLNRLDDEAEFPISDEEDDDEDVEDEEVESDAEDESEDDDSDDGAGVSGKSAWAESISKILGSKHTGILSKAQTIADIEKKKAEKKKITFEVVDGDAKKIKLEDNKPDQETIERIMRRRKRREQREVRSSMSQNQALITYNPP